MRYGIIRGEDKYTDSIPRNISPYPEIAAINNQPEPFVEPLGFPVSHSISASRMIKATVIFIIALIFSLSFWGAVISFMYKAGENLLMTIKFGE